MSIIKSCINYCCSCLSAEVQEAVYKPPAYPPPKTIPSKPGSSTAPAANEKLSDAIHPKVNAVHQKVHNLLQENAGAEEFIFCFGFAVQNKKGNPSKKLYSYSSVCKITLPLVMQDMKKALIEQKRLKTIQKIKIQWVLIIKPKQGEIKYRLEGDAKWFSGTCKSGFRSMDVNSDQLIPLQLHEYSRNNSRNRTPSNHSQSTNTSIVRSGVTLDPIANTTSYQLTEIALRRIDVDLGPIDEEPKQSPSKEETKEGFFDTADMKRDLN